MRGLFGLGDDRLDVVMEIGKVLANANANLNRGSERVDGEVAFDGFEERFHQEDGFWLAGEFQIGEGDLVARNLQEVAPWPAAGLEDDVFELIEDAGIDRAVLLGRFPVTEIGDARDAFSQHRAMDELLELFDGREFQAGFANAVRRHEFEEIAFHVDAAEFPVDRGNLEHREILLMAFGEHDARLHIGRGVGFRVEELADPFDQPHLLIVGELAIEIGERHRADGT